MAWLFGVEHQGANGGVVWLVGLANGVCALSRDPCLLCNHLSLCESTSLVGANISDTTKSLERLQVANNDVTLHHALCAGGHCDGQDDGKGGGNHTETSGYGVDDDLAVVGEAVGGQNDDCADDGDTEKEDGETSELLLQGSTDVDTKEVADGIGSSQRPCLGVAMRFGFAIRLALDFADAGTLLSKRHGDGTDLSVHSSSKDDTTGASLGNGRGAVGDIEAVTRAGVLVENGIAIFVDWEGFASK